MKKPISTKVLEYDGFESLYDLDRDLMWEIENWKELPPEYEGVVRLTLEYFPAESEDECQ